MADNHGQSNDPNTGKLTGNQIIQQARGHLVKRNDSRVLARGELFIQTVDALSGTGTHSIVTGNLVKPENVATGKNRMYDLGTKSFINTYFEGDLFAGSGKYGEVWSLGSGGALKWGGVTGASSWDALKSLGKTRPNYIFMYVGARPIESPANDGQRASDGSISTLNKSNIKGREPGTREEASVDVESRYVGHDPAESTEIINPGDLFFYSPVYDENVVIHLSHSTDALTKINQFALVSNSMKAYFKDKLGELGEDGTRFATLKDFLDGPARRFQSMIGDEGWNAVTITAVEENDSEDEVNHIIGCANITPNDFADTDFDGAIHYIPFTNGRHRVPFVAGEATDQQWTGEKRLHEGDLILTIPVEGGGVKYSVISLYGGLLDMLSAKNLNFHRADAYADSVWNQENATKDYDETDEEFKANLENTITDYILRLFETKVDIDPYTKKIISSQLPDFLLGAPKYMGAIDEVNPLDDIINAIKAGEDPEKVNAHDVAKEWSEKFANIDKNDDDETSDKGSENEEKDPTDDNYDTRLQAGCYWIWNAGHLVIDDLGDYFNLQNKDDFDEDAVDPETGDNLSGDKKVGEFVHALENGDWIMYNGANKKFDILDNSSTFVGIIMDGVKLSGTPEFKDYQRTINEKDWDGKAVAATGTKAPHEVKLDPQDTHDLEFRSPNAVLFKEDGASGEAFVDDNHLPVISDKGTAKNSRIELTKNHAGLKLPKTGKEDASPALDSIEFLFSKYINEGVTEYSLTNAGSDDLNIVMFGENNPGDSYVKHGFGKKADQLASTTSNTVLDFQEFKFTQESDRDTKGVGKYRFEILGEKAPVLELPTYSGVLATETYVDSGFVVVKKIIEDLYDEIMKQTTSGRIDWLQTLVPADTPTGKKIYDSRIKQILTRGDDENDRSAVNSLSFGFYLVKAFDDAHEEVLNNLSLYTKVTVKKELDESDGPIDLKIGDTTYNPSHLPVGGSVNNVLPNHGGILLNNNSVIDGGEWL